MLQPNALGRILVKVPEVKPVRVQVIKGEQAALDIENAPDHSQDLAQRFAKALLHPDHVSNLAHHAALLVAPALLATEVGQPATHPGRACPHQPPSGRLSSHRAESARHSQQSRSRHRHDRSKGQSPRESPPQARHHAQKCKQKQKPNQRRKGNQERHQENQVRNMKSPSQDRAPHHYQPGHAHQQKCQRQPNPGAHAAERHPGGQKCDPEQQRIQEPRRLNQSLQFGGRAARGNKCKRFNCHLP